MREVPGTRGYEDHVEAFVRSSQALPFETLCGAFLPFLPAPGARVLDAGAGAGQNAAALARQGYEVVAIEPMPAFLDAARTAYGDLPIVWLLDSLPTLGRVRDTFDFVLIEAVWHHLSPEERCAAISRLAALLHRGGHLALSLRNGPAGAGTHVFPTDVEATVATMRAQGLEPVFRVTGRPSLLPGKPNVTWARLVFRRG